jgi:hypothetical protein
MDNNAELRLLIADYKLTAKDVATLLSSQYGSINYRSVHNWMCNFRTIPGTTLELLVLKLKYEIVE